MLKNLGTLSALGLLTVQGTKMESKPTMELAQVGLHEEEEADAAAAVVDDDADADDVDMDGDEESDYDAEEGLEIDNEEDATA